MSGHCSDLAEDRKIGAYWERAFCALAANHAKAITALQLASPDESAAAHFRTNEGGWSRWALPDVVVWTSPGEHHEIKHKTTTPDGRYGLEQYRFQALVEFARETRQDVLYTIHDWGLAGGKDVTVNHIDHWRTAPILSLVGKGTATEFPSWRGGQRVDKTPGLMWPASLWTPLADYWARAAAEDRLMEFFPAATRGGDAA